MKINGTSGAYGAYNAKTVRKVVRAEGSGAESKGDEVVQTAQKGCDRGRGLSCFLVQWK